MGAMTRLHPLARQVLEACKDRSIMMATAESCTGGMIAALLTDIAGSSAVVDRGFVTYTNAAKHEVLGVPPDMIERVGAVSEQVARRMADGAMRQSRAQVTVSVTGIAGPGGGSEDKPVGLVHMAVARAGAATLHERHVFPGDRSRVRSQTVEAALRLVLRGLGESNSE